MPEVNGRYVPPWHASAKRAEKEATEKVAEKPAKKRAVKKTRAKKAVETAMVVPADDAENATE